MQPDVIRIARALLVAEEDFHTRRSDEHFLEIIRRVTRSPVVVRLNFHRERAGQVGDRRPQRQVPAEPRSIAGNRQLPGNLLRACSDGYRAVDVRPGRVALRAEGSYEVQAGHVNDGSIASGIEGVSVVRQDDEEQRAVADQQTRVVRRRGGALLVADEELDIRRAEDHFARLNLHREAAGHIRDRRHESQGAAVTGNAARQIERLGHATHGEGFRDRRSRGVQLNAEVSGQVESREIHHRRITAGFESEGSIRSRHQHQRRTAHANTDVIRARTVPLVVADEE